MLKGRVESEQRRSAIKHQCMKHIDNLTKSKMKRLINYGYILCAFMICCACNPEEDDVPPPQIDESLLSGKWMLTEARGLGNFTSTGGTAGNITGSFLFIGVESVASLEFPTGVLAGAVYRDGAVAGTMIYEPGNLGFSEDTLLWDGMLPNGAWTLTGANFHVSGGPDIGDFDGVIDELTENTFILTGHTANITVIGNPGGNIATLDGVYTFTFTR